MALFRRKAEPDPKEAFLRDVEAGCREILGATDVRRVGDTGFEVVTPGGGQPAVLDVGNVWLEVRDRTPEEQRAVLATFLQRLARRSGPEPSWDEVAPQLRPVVRGIGWATGQPADSAPPRRPVVPFVSGLLAIDEGAAMRFAGPATVASWPVDLDAAWQRAIDNLTADGLPGGEVEGPLEGCVLIMGPDSYQSSWLAAHAWLAERADKLPTDPVLLAPCRDQALLVSIHDHRALLAAIEWADTAHREEARPLSPAPYLLTADGFVPWHPATHHPARVAVENAHRMLALTEYHDQTTHVQDLLDKAGEDVYVASLEGMRVGDGSITTWTAWPPDVTDGLLPEADVVAMFADEARRMVRWADVVRLAPEAIVREPGWEPARWRIRGRPDPDVVAQLHDLVMEPGED